MITNGMAHNPPAGGEGHISRDKDTIREWADKHNMVPVREPDTGGSTGRFRMVPEDQVSESQDRVNLETFHDHLHEGDRAVIYHGEESDEPFEIAGQRDIETRVDDEEIRDRLIEGETVTSEITEATVVETVVVEEMEVESELVDTSTVDQHVVDVELLGRECSNCQFIEDQTVEARDLFDSDRYLSTFGDRTSERMETTAADTDDLPYHPEVDLEERWAVTRELTEQFTVESHITGADITEADTIEDYDIDIEGLHRSIVESGLIHGDRSPDEILAQSDVRSEMGERNRVQTTFTRDRTVEDEVVDRKHLRTEVTGVELLDMETTHSQSAMTGEPAGEGVTTDEGTPESVVLTDDAVGNTVVNASGEEVGMVTAVEEDQNRMYVDVHPGIAERISAALGWGGSDKDDYVLTREQISRITDDGVQLRSQEHLPDSEHDR